MSGGPRLFSGSNRVVDTLLHKLDILNHFAEAIEKYHAGYVIFEAQNWFKSTYQTLHICLLNS